MRKPRRADNETTQTESRNSFKAKVAIVALRGNQTLSELAQQFDVHPNQIVQRRAQLQEHAKDLFATAAERKAESGPNVKDLHAKIGQTAELDLKLRVLCPTPWSQLSLYFQVFIQKGQPKYLVVTLDTLLAEKMD